MKTVCSMEIFPILGKLLGFDKLEGVKRIVITLDIDNEPPTVEITQNMRTMEDPEAADLVQKYELKEITTE